MSDSLLSLSIAAGPSRPVLTTLPQFIVHIAKSGISGPVLRSMSCLDWYGRYIASGGQYTVFEHRDKSDPDYVMKRVHAGLLSPKLSSEEMDDRRKGHLRTIELEILALSHAPIRDHPNIIKLISWGLDYPTPTRQPKMALPVLNMEKASGSLLELLQNPERYGLEAVPIATRYQLNLDILEGLRCLHRENIVHGDLKPANILIFRQQSPEVPFIAKINDFGMCVSLEEASSISYGSYQGTPEWVAPEIQKYRTGYEETIEDVKLCKCDVFSLGLLVLSVLFLAGEPPLKYDVHIEDSAIAAADRLLHESERTQELDLAFDTKMRDFIRSTLKINPSERSKLDGRLLGYSCPAFQAWFVSRFFAPCLLCFLIR